jgi:hypothetical protein
MGGKQRASQSVLISGHIDNGIFKYQHGSSLVQRG